MSGHAAAQTWDAQAIVSALYRTLLKREADPEGLASHARFLADGGSLELLVQSLLGSAEFQAQGHAVVRGYATPPRRVVDAEADARDGGPPAVRDLMERLQAHPTWGGEDRLTALGLPLPRLDRVIPYRLADPKARAALAERGIHVDSRPEAHGNWLLLDESVTAAGLRVALAGSTGAVIAMGEGCAVRGAIGIQADRALVVLGGHPHFVQGYEVHIEGNDAVFVFGDGSTCVGASFHIGGSARHIVVGRDCMLSAGLYIAGTDNHAVLDRATGELLNPPQDVRIGPRAWIGHGAMVLKGAHVGRGAIVAARALVTAPAPDHTLVAGAPARVLRENVDWSRAPPGTGV